MESATLSLVLALFCGIVSASWGPSDLTTRVDSSKGDFVDINARWDPGSCPFAHFKLYSESPEQPKTEEASTSDVHYTIVNKECWTNYTVILETSWCFDAEPLQTQISTGPGNPHKVASVKTASSALEANVTITEAFMPRPVDKYNITWCSSPADCQTQVFARNNHGPATTFNVTLKELRPETVYNLTVVPEILFEGGPLRGSEFTTKLVTKQIQLPVPTNVETSFPWGEEDHQEVKLSWTLGDTPYELAYYTVNITCEDDPTFKRSQRVETPEAIFGNMPNSAKLTARITPIFNISKNLMHHDGAITTFTTPPPAPEPTNFAFVPLSLTSIFAHWNTVPEVPESDLSFDFTYTNPKNKTTALTVNGTSVLVENLAANTTYRVVISLISKLRQPHFMEKEFSTLAEDYAAPASVNMEPLTEIPQDMLYNMTWTTIDHPAKASRFQVEVCHRDSTGCTRNETGETNMVLPLSFFGNFSITVSAIYDLNLNQTQVRPAHALTMETPGVEPSEVTNITLQNVTSTNAVLRWTAPANIPENISKIYEVFDAENNLTDQTTTEQIQLVNLSPFSLYNINIQATVLYNKTEYSGNKTFFRFYTDSAEPGAPETVKVEQIVRTNVFKVSWTPPRAMNGKLDYYEVLTKDESGDVVSNLTNLTGTSGVTVVLPLAHSDAVYNVSVRAVNVNLEGESLPGNATESVLLFKGIAPPTADVVKRRSDSLILKVTPSNATEDITGLFFTIKNGNNSFSNDSDHIEVKNLSAYTNETLEVYACYLPTFCSEAFTIIELTNVDGPSPVNDLEGNFINRTIPFFNWTAPTLLNGPLNGYLVNLRDLSNSSLDIKKVLPADQTSFVYETSMEFEKYTFAVSGFNYDLDKEEVRLVGAISSVRVNTTGEHPPKPENVREVNKTSTSFSIEWEKPQYADFNVTFYHIVVPSLGMDEMTNETRITLSGLKPWTNTKVEASGCTDDNVTTCGFAGSYSIWTGVANPSQPHSIEFTDVTETEAMVSWKAPLTPNGPINGYKIAVSMTDNQNLTWDEVTEGAASHHFSNLTADTKYTLHLLAYNLEDSTGEELLSPPSIAEFSTAGSGGFAWWIVVVALVVIAAGATIGVVVYKRRNAQGEDGEQLVWA